MNNLRKEVREQINKVVSNNVAAGNYDNDKQLEVQCIQKVICFEGDTLDIVDYTKLRLQLELLKRELGINLVNDTVETKVIEQITNELKQIRKEYEQTK